MLPSDGRAAIQPRCGPKGRSHDKEKIDNWEGRLEDTYRDRGPSRFRSRRRDCTPGSSLLSALERTEQPERSTMSETFTLHVNGETHRVQADPDMPLLYALRDDL